MQILNHKKDKLTLVFITTIIAIRMFIWFNNPVAYYIYIPLLVALVFILYSIKHNHLHVKTFKNKRLNKILNYLLGTFTGTSSQAAFIVHVVNHHQTNNTHHDWGTTQNLKSRYEILNLIKYAFVTPIIFQKNKKEWLKQSTKSKLYNIANFESRIIVVSYVILMFIKFEPTLTYILLPNFLVQLVLVSFNYFQHRHTIADSIYSHSRNFTGKLLNFLTFNNGYHTAHHLYPNKHWSEYHKIHLTLNKQIPHSLNESNLLYYFVKLVFSKNTQPGLSIHFKRQTSSGYEISKV